MNQPAPGKETVILNLVKTYSSPAPTSELCRRLDMKGAAIRAHLCNLRTKGLVFSVPTQDLERAWTASEDQAEQPLEGEEIVRRFVSAADAPRIAPPFPQWVFSLADQMGARA